MKFRFGLVIGTSIILRGLIEPLQFFLEERERGIVKEIGKLEKEIRKSMEFKHTRAHDNNLGALA